MYVYRSSDTIGARFTEGVAKVPRQVNLRRQLVVGNWKMHGSLMENERLLKQIVAGWRGVHKAEVVVCPPFTYIAQAAGILMQSNIVWGAQSVSARARGAHTGAVSASMLADLQCRYVIIGHREQRHRQGGADEQIAQQFMVAQKAKIAPILCVGEPPEVHDFEQTLAAICCQLHTVIDLVGINAFRRAVIVYEPNRAVGRGIILPERTQEIHEYIRAQFGRLGEGLRVLYGGSVKAQNAEQLFAMEDIDGALLGSASLHAKEFLTICRCAE